MARRKKPTPVQGRRRDYSDEFKAEAVQVLLPHRHLIRMNLKLLRNLADRSQPPNRFQSNLRLELPV